EGVGGWGGQAAFADPDFVVIAVNLAIARTHLTGAERINRFGGAFLKNTLFESTDVGRNEILARQNKSPTAGQLEGRVASGVKASTHGRGLNPVTGATLNAQPHGLNPPSPNLVRPASRTDSSGAKFGSTARPTSKSRSRRARELLPVISYLGHGG